MKNTCEQVICRVVINCGMQCEKCKGWFQVTCTDFKLTAYNRLGKSDRMWIYGSFDTNTGNLLSNITVSAKGLCIKLLRTLKKVFLKGINK